MDVEAFMIKLAGLPNTLQEAYSILNKIGLNFITIEDIFKNAKGQSEVFSDWIFLSLLEGLRSRRQMDDRLLSDINFVLDATTLFPKHKKSVMTFYQDCCYDGLKSKSHQPKEEEEKDELN